MSLSQLVRRNLTHYWRSNLAVIAGVATAVGVLAGALLVGESVRGSLRDLIYARLGQTAFVVTSGGFLREDLATDLMQGDGSSEVGGVAPLIALEASIVHERSGRRAVGVQAYAVDERFWRFHGLEERVSPLSDREAYVSPGLARELDASSGDALLVRVQRPGEIPEGSLFGRKEDTSRRVRLLLREALQREQLGEFSLRAEQGEVRAVFVSLARAQRDLGVQGKVGTLLMAEPPSSQDAGDSADRLKRLVSAKATLADLGLSIRTVEGGHALALEHQAGLLTDELVNSATRAASAAGLRPVPVFSYLANAIRIGQREIPYSIVSAIDLAQLSAGPPGLSPTSERQRGLPPTMSSNDPTADLPPIVLNDWAVKALDAKPDETVTMTYYVWLDEGRLETRTADFRLAATVPIAGLAADRDLVPDYPGITESNSLSDWDPPFPIDLSRVHPPDEAYWREYRTTPKAFVPIEVGQRLWASRFGRVTSLRMREGETPLASDAREQMARALTSTITPEEAGLTVTAVRAGNLAAARGATDFGEYFTYFSFFLVVSALMLATLFFRFGLEQRAREIGLLRAVGFPGPRLRTVFLSEALILAVVGGALGVALALGYGALMVHGLRTWWVAAVGTTALTLHASPQPLLIGAIGGLLAALACIVWTLWRLGALSPRTLLAGFLAPTADVAQGPATLRVGRRRRLALFPAVPIALAVMSAGLLIGAAFGRIPATAGFFGGGSAFLLAALTMLGGKLRRPVLTSLVSGAGSWRLVQLGFHQVRHRPGRSVLSIALVAFATFIIVAVDAFRRDAPASLDRGSGVGGYALIAQSTAPLYHDPETVEGRDALNLVPLQDAALERIRFDRFRVRPGDDTSCLNLYAPASPRILGATSAFVTSGRFSFSDSLARTDAERANPWLLLDAELDPGVVPVIADQTSLTYVLHAKVGDDLPLEIGGNTVRFRVVAALADSVLQRELIVSEQRFLELFPDRDGYSFFLIDVGDGDPAEVAGLLESRLSDFGFDAEDARVALAAFHEVENTYLSTFQMLGALGLLLGTFGLGAVLLRNVLERRRELALMRAVGFSSARLALLVLAENLWLLGWGVLIGVIAALLAILPTLMARGGVPTVSLAVILPAVIACGVAVSALATAAALRTPLLPALRTE